MARSRPSVAAASQQLPYHEEGESSQSQSQQQTGQTQFDSSTDEPMYEVINILKEKSGLYLVNWAGIDPDTGRAWKSTWIPKSHCTNPLIKEWKDKCRELKEKKAAAKKAKALADKEFNPKKPRESSRESSTAKRRRRDSSSASSNVPNKRSKTAPIPEQRQQLRFASPERSSVAPSEASSSRRTYANATSSTSKSKSNAKGKGRAKVPESSDEEEEERLDPAESRSSSRRASASSKRSRTREDVKLYVEVPMSREGSRVQERAEERDSDNEILTPGRNRGKVKQYGKRPSGKYKKGAPLPQEDDEEEEQDEPEFMVNNEEMDEEPAPRSLSRTPPLGDDGPAEGRGPARAESIESQRAPEEEVVMEDLFQDDFPPAPHSVAGDPEESVDEDEPDPPPLPLPNNRRLRPASVSPPRSAPSPRAESPPPASAVPSSQSLSQLGRSARPSSSPSVTPPPSAPSAPAVLRSDPSSALSKQRPLRPVPQPDEALSRQALAEDVARRRPEQPASSQIEEFSQTTGARKTGGYHEEQEDGPEEEESAMATKLNVQAFGSRKSPSPVVNSEAGPSRPAPAATAPFRPVEAEIVDLTSSDEQPTDLTASSIQSSLAPSQPPPPLKAASLPPPPSAHPAPLTRSRPTVSANTLTSTSTTSSVTTTTNLLSTTASTSKPAAVLQPLSAIKKTFAFSTVSAELEREDEHHPSKQARQGEENAKRAVEAAMRADGSSEFGPDDGEGDVAEGRAWDSEGEEGEDGFGDVDFGMRDWEMMDENVVQEEQDQPTPTKDKGKGRLVENGEDEAEQDEALERILNHLELADTQRFDMVVQIGLLPPSDRAGFIATLDSFASRTIAALVSLRSSLAEEQTAHSATSEADKSRITYLEARVKSSNSDFDFVKAQYDQASTHAARFSRELQEAEETIVTLRGQVKAGLDLARQTYKRRCEGLEGELRVYKAQVGVMKEVARKTDGIRERAGRVDGLENEVRRLRAALEEETEDRKRFEVRSKTAEERIRRELPPPEEDDSDDDSDGAGSFRPDESDGGSDSDYEDSDVEEEVAGLAAVDDVAIPPAQSQADASASSATQTQSETQTHPTQPSAFSIFHGLAPALAPFAAHSNQSQPSLQPEPKPSFRSGSFFSPSVSPARSPPSQPRPTSTSAATAAIVNLSASPAVANLSPPQAFNAAFLDSQQTHPQAQPPAATTATTPETQQTQTQQSSTIFPLNSLSRNAVGYVQALLTGGGAFGMDVDDDEHDENEDPAVARSTAGGMQADAPLPKPDFGPNPNVCLWRVPAGTVSIPTSAADSRNGEGFCLVVAENEDALHAHVCADHLP